MIPALVAAALVYGAYRWRKSSKGLVSKYVMAPGDTADAIGARFGITQLVLKNMNPKAAPGMTLALPNVKDLGSRVGATGKASVA